MTFTEGGCLCGKVRFRSSGEVGPAGYCHYLDCRKLTGGPYGISAPVGVADFEIVGGVLGSFTKLADSGRPLTRHFCPRCGSPIYTSAPAHPDIVYIKAGTFNDPAVVRPTLEAWRDSRVTWAVIPDELTRFVKGRAT